MQIDVPTVPEAYADFEKGSAAYSTWLKAEKPIPREVIDGLFRLAVRVMISYQHPFNWPDGDTGKPLHHFPPQVSQICSDFTRYILAGKLPGPIAQLLGRGTPAIGPEEARDICQAVAYIDAAQRGIIQDRKYTQTIATTYAVDARTVQRWVRHYKAKNVTYELFVPPNVQTAEVGALILNGMKQAGERYRLKARAATKRPRKSKRS